MIVIKSINISIFFTASESAISCHPFVARRGELLVYLLKSLSRIDDSRIIEFFNGNTVRLILTLFQLILRSRSMNEDDELGYES